MTRAVAHDSDVLGRAVARAKSMTVSKEAKEASCIVHLRQSKAWRGHDRIVTCSQLVAMLFPNRRGI